MLTTTTDVVDNIVYSSTTAFTNSSDIPTVITGNALVSSMLDYDFYPRISSPAAIIGTTYPTEDIIGFKGARQSISSSTDGKDLYAYSTGIAEIQTLLDGKADSTSSTLTGNVTINGKRVSQLLVADFDRSPSKTSTGAVITTYGTYTIPGISPNSLVKIDMLIQIGGTGTKTISLSFNGTTVLSHADNGTGYVKVEGMLYSASDSMSLNTIKTSTGTSTVMDSYTTNINVANPITITVNGVGTATVDNISIKSLSISAM
jgi:hypothetical protein